MTFEAILGDFTRTVEDASARPRERREHNLHEIGRMEVSREEPATPEHLMRDHVGHLKHHLRRILGEP